MMNLFIYMSRESLPTHTHIYVARITTSRATLAGINICIYRNFVFMHRHVYFALQGFFLMNCSEISGAFDATISHKSSQLTYRQTGKLTACCQFTVVGRSHYCQLLLVLQCCNRYCFGLCFFVTFHHFWHVLRPHNPVHFWNFNSLVYVIIYCFVIQLLLLVFDRKRSTKRVSRSCLTCIQKRAEETP